MREGGAGGERNSGGLRTIQEVQGGTEAGGGTGGIRRNGGGRAIHEA